VKTYFISVQFNVASAFVFRYDIQHIHTTCAITLSWMHFLPFLILGSSWAKLRWARTQNSLKICDGSWTVLFPWFSLTTMYFQHVLLEFWALKQSHAWAFRVLRGRRNYLKQPLMKWFHFPVFQLFHVFNYIAEYSYNWTYSSLKNCDCMRRTRI